MKGRRRNDLPRDKRLVVTYVVLRLIVLFTLVAQAMNHNYENVFYCILALILFMLPSIIERRMLIDIPDTLEIIILVFIFAAEILGEIRAYYQKIPAWDTALHTVTGFLTGAIGFSLVSLLNRESEHFNLTPTYLAFVSLCFSMFIGVMWEFLEFFMDWFFATDMQKDTIIHTINTVLLDESKTNTVVHIRDIREVVVNGTDLGVGGYIDIGLVDTMKDLAVTLLGSVSFSVFGFFYERRHPEGELISNLIPKVRKSGEEKEN